MKTETIEIETIETTNEQNSMVKRGEIETEAIKSLFPFVDSYPNTLSIVEYNPKLWGNKVRLYNKDFNTVINWGTDCSLLSIIISAYRAESEVSYFEIENVEYEELDVEVGVIPPYWREDIQKWVQLKKEELIKKFDL